MNDDAVAGSKMEISPQFADVFRELGIDADGIFEHPLIRPWRTLPDRENCTLVGAITGRDVCWHIKRYAPSRWKRNPAETEVAGLRLLMDRGIPTMDLVGWGTLRNGRSFVILDDLRGYRPADKLVAAGLPFERILQPTADLAAKLHAAGLHHRDLYLCHIFAKDDGDALDLRLIDAARVRQLPALFPRRWIIKDLAQFWYSTLALPITDDQRRSWLERYAALRTLGDTSAIRRRIERKVASIARHDARARAAQPRRNISIPEGSGVAP